jgi:hypothetical protein
MMNDCLHIVQHYQQPSLLNLAQALLSRNGTFSSATMIW